MFFNKKIIIASSVFLVIIFSLVIFVIYPVFKNIRDYSEVLVDLERDLVLFEGKVVDFENIKKDYQNYEPNLDKINTLFVDSETPVNFIKYIERTAASSDVFISISFGSSRISKEAPWDSMGFQIAVNGSYSNFLRFLERIELGTYLIEVESVNLKKLSDSKIQLGENEKFSKDDISGSLNIKVFSK